MKSILVMLALALATGPAFARPVTSDELMRALHDRDRVIAQLEKRIEALEAVHGSVDAPARNDPSAPALAANQPPAGLPLPAAPPAAPIPTATASDPEDDVALQALSRTLVERGALVLPEWAFEVAPSIGYSHNQNAGLVLVTTPEGFQTVDSQRLRDDSVRASVAARVGLPWDSQIELRVPYVWSEESTVLGDGTHARNSASDIGDVEVELSHQLVRERGWRPDLLAAVSARFPTGQDPFNAAIPNIASGSGTYQVRGRLTAVTHSDPMVFYGTGSYAADFPRTESFGRVHPGPTIGLDVGTILAVSPDASLTLGFSQSFTAKTEIDGKGVPGTDQVSSVLQFGLDYVLRPDTLLDVSLGIGVTNDAPDYTLVFTLPIR